MQYRFFNIKIKNNIIKFIFPFLMPFTACAQNASNVSNTNAFKEMEQTKKDNMMMDKKPDTATFAAGCFWCVEAQFKELKGVKKVVSGFTGGTVPHPSYEEVCTGTTGHAEACNIIYNPSEISYDALLAAFFVAHDPTQLNRQGADVGTQYRSAIFYHNAEQKKLAEYYIGKLNEEKAYPNPIVTEVQPFTVFYKAEGYHQDYYAKNGSVPYCQLVIKPKVDKFEEVFKGKLKQ
ncbi:peptide-methionine (S)-S-oxide reductase MsrA [Arachidicoccus ginsenosidimutans]|uniref:peptide-methionine (S)-S-oxide reductase MsrA n=1 Tax=Arachidicoccus sp. BS20 TaxID=1850526 RepID=UPI0009EF5409|nr:peptide-methionine (S)-S-oxide reductase MsrA [Arachidicoccus sp. BS20]